MEVRRSGLRAPGSIYKEIEYMGNLLRSVKQNPVLWIWNLLSYDNFLVHAMTFFIVIGVQGFHFHSKIVIKSSFSRLSLNGRHALWTGGGVLLYYMRQPCKGQVSLCRFGQ